VHFTYDPEGPNVCVFNSRPVIAATADAGRTWRVLALPLAAWRAVSVPSGSKSSYIEDFIGTTSGLACTNGQDCWFALPTGALASTTNTGRTWEPVQMPGNGPVANMSCPAPAQCVALGVTRQGSASAPVYSSLGARKL
jgi:photosystem II stability/assembly factor-like uncharacterized protein